MTRGRGRIEVILGPMFSGKTTELIRRMRRFRLANFKCVILKYTKDSRYSEKDIATHDLQTLNALPCCSLKTYKSKANECEVVGIDEGQFFPDLIEFCEDLANMGKIVIVAALDGTYRRMAFGDILQLIPLAENVIKLNAICMSCFQNASFTKRISAEKAVEIIGGADKYMAVCRECFHQSENGKSEKIRSALKENINSL
ncbi:UNVERIFIED_CONTAM: hypothetical protein PYX00_010427 [Menopon gallinae]|uniref:Thymidine kinase n=1 Tax=Menopon gallinae TaxID=328185 RepID=A0AAW2HG77_9NEOP